MANYNSGIKYNFKKPDGGALYNSAPFLVIVYDSGIGSDIVSNLTANISANDTGIGDDAVQATATLSPILDFGVGEDSLSLSANINVSDDGIGEDAIDSVLCNIAVIDTATGQEFISIARAFFIISGDSMLLPLNVLVLGDSRYTTFPSLKEYSEEIPGKNGEVNFGSHLGSRLLELHIASPDGLTPEQKEAFKRDCAKYLNPTNGAKNLIFSDDIDKTYTVKFSGKIDPSQYADWMDFTIPFKMASPYITGSFEKMQVGSGTLNNAGNEETPLNIQIGGSITNPVITIGTSTISYNGTINAGQTLVIDTENMTAELDGVNVVDNLSGDLPFLLQPGETSVTADTKCLIAWNDRWV